jgi:hypothetical protein
VGECDVNRFYGSLSDLRAFVGITTGTEPPTPPPDGLSDHEKVEALWAYHPEIHPK